MKVQRRATTILLCFYVLISLVQIWAQSLWIVGGSETEVLVQIGLQRTRAQAIAKDVLILAYRSDQDERTQAFDELQKILPLFEKTQNGLSVGDTSLHFPGRVPSDVKLLMAAASPDFLSIDYALRKILAAPQKPMDPFQRDIILRHEHGYSLAMTQISNAWQARIDLAFYVIAWIVAGLAALLLALNIGEYWYLRRGVLKNEEGVG